MFHISIIETHCCIEDKVLIAMFFSLNNIGKHCTTQEASTEIPMLHKLDRDCFLLPSHISVGGFFFGNTRPQKHRPWPVSWGKSRTNDFYVFIDVRYLSDFQINFIPTQINNWVIINFWRRQILNLKHQCCLYLLILIPTSRPWLSCSCFCATNSSHHRYMN